MIVVLAPLVLDSFSLQVATWCLIFGLFAISYDLVFGYTGLTSIGHATYFGLGGYAAGLVGMHLSDNAFVAIGVGAGAGAISAAVTGGIALRAREVYFLMLTVAFTELAAALATSWSSVTGGSNGLVGIPALTLGSGLTMNGLINGRDFYYFVAILTVLSYFVLWNICRAPLGRAFVGIRENETRMEALGYAVRLHKLLAYTVAGGFAGIAGALWAFDNSIISPADVGFSNSALVLVMVMVGGAGTLYGGIVGAILIMVLRAELSPHLQSWEGIIGLIFIVVVYLAPRGLAGLVGAGSGASAAKLLSRILPSRVRWVR